MTNWDMTNAQKTLTTRRPETAVRPIARLAETYRPGAVWEPDPDPLPPVRSYRVTPLEDFRYGHLNQEQAVRLRHAVGKAQHWLDSYQAQPGLGFVIAGPVGVGKTTIAENLMQTFRRRCVVAEGSGSDRFSTLVQAALDKMPPEDPRRTAVAQVLNDGGSDDIDETAVEVLDGMLIEATQLMRLVGDETPLDSTFGRARVVIIDDAGSEEIDYSNERTEVTKRHARYGRFLDYCYRHKKHVLVTSMTPMLVDGRIDSAFVDIFGQKAFSRLYQMAAGYMVDLHGLPDYRPLLVNPVMGGG